VLNDPVPTRDWRLIAALTAFFVCVIAGLLPGGGSALIAAAAIAPRSFGLPLLWLLAAAGLGLSLRRLHIGPAGNLPVTLALGAALLLTVTNLLARCGVLSAGNGLVAWSLIVACIAGGGLALFTKLKQTPRSSGPSPTLRTLHLPGAGACAAMALGIAALLWAAHASPGWLWRSEFGGYDVLSYHLQLPAEWRALGIVRGMEHNVYAFLPSFMETAFLHLMVLGGDVHHAAIPAQMLHASIVLIAAASLANTAKKLGGAGAQWIPPALMMGTPWVIVCGSMAYNEGVLLLAVSAGMSVIVQTRPLSASDSGDTPLTRDACSASRWRTTWIPLGLLTGAACGAKPTALFLVGVPLATALLLMHPMRPIMLLRCAGIGGAVAVLPLLPWLIQNAAVCGNPVFPFATGFFGTGHWSDDQVERWRAAHHVEPSLRSIFNQFLRQGIGPAPSGSTEPWLAQWSILPLLGLAGAICAIRPMAGQPWRMHPPAVLALMVLVQLCGWMLLTHQQARFLVPAAPLLALLAMFIVPAGVRHPSPTATTPPRRTLIAGLTAALLIAWATLPVIILRGEGGGRPLDAVAAAAVMNGSAVAEFLAENPGLDDETRRDLARAGGPPYWIRFMLPPDSRVLCVGWATPFYLPTTGTAYRTVWDRGPWSDAYDDVGGDAQAMRRRLSAEGWTHLLIDMTMLHVWERSGWSDPSWSPHHVRTIVESSMEEVIDDDRGARLFRIMPARY